jgi:hypothetical protein
MALDPRSFMKTIETRIGFTADDKVLLKPKLLPIKNRLKTS